MAKLSKRRQFINSRIVRGQSYSLLEAIDLLKAVSQVKFNETVEISVNLGVDPRKSDQIIRGAVVLPYGIGRVMRVAVFAQGEQAEAAQAAGADRVGFEDLATWIKGGNLDFDVVIATPEAMRIVGQLGPVLGPRGLMPNPKLGTVAQDVSTAVRNSKAGQVHYHTDKGGIVHCILGKLGFQPVQLQHNLAVLLDALKKAKPSTAKGVFFKKITLSSSMGPGLLLEQTSLSMAST